jgi:hypothetical protein
VLCLRINDDCHSEQTGCVAIRVKVVMFSI